MNQSLPRKMLIIFTATLILLAGYRQLLFRKPNNIQASGDLEITYNDVTLGDPVFFLEDTKPGDHVCREIEVANNGQIARFIAVKGVKTGGIGPGPLLEQVLEIVISENSTAIYGDASSTGIKTVEDFFNDSLAEDGVLLSVVGIGRSTAYEFCVDFPASAGNEYQEKSVIFDLIFGYVSGDHLVINEVYYGVDDDHGLDCPKDRGIEVDISGNGAGSTNTIILNLGNTCVINQSNTSNINNSINISTSTGGNFVSRITTSFTSIVTGTVNSFTSIFNFGNINFASCDLCCNDTQNASDEWVELFNPTEQTVELDGWFLEDNSVEVEFSTGISIEPGGFVLISKSLLTWDYWDENPSAGKIALGQNIGDGLDNEGDHLYLKNPQGEIVDFTAWGNDTEDWDPAVPLVSLGNSMERLTPGFDTDVPEDWEPRFPPTPGM